MVDDGKKISFSFSKVSAKSKVIPIAKQAQDKSKQYVECVEKNLIKIIGIDEEKHHGPLIIPMPTSVNRNLSIIQRKAKQNNDDDSVSNGRALTLEEMAVRELLSGNNQKELEEEKIVEVPMIVNPPDGKEESTVEDYLNVPIQQFGLAMLRGMGWEPEKGIGKNAKLVTSNVPELRPKGMGLGADKLIKSTQKSKATDEELKLKIGSFVQFICGRLDGQYGQVFGFDEGAARVIVKMARSSQMEKVGENIFRLVTKNDYDKNSKVLNIREYKEYNEGKNSVPMLVDNNHKIEHQTKINNEYQKKSEYTDRSRHHKTKKSKHSKSPDKKHKSGHTKHKKNKHKRSSS